MQKENLKAAESVTDANADERKGLHQLFAITLTRPFSFPLYGTDYLFRCCLQWLPLRFGLPLQRSLSAGFWLPNLSWGFTTSMAVRKVWHFSDWLLGPSSLSASTRYKSDTISVVLPKNDGKGVPEARMWMARLGAIFIPVSLFWFAWTSYSSIHWIVPIIASSMFGAGIYIIILSILNYVVDSYQTYSASALAGVILVRNIVGAGFPLFATQMYETLNLEWASSLLAFIAILLVCRSRLCSSIGASASG